MTVVFDASLVIAALIDDGPDGRWAESVIAERDLVAPPPDAGRGFEYPAQIVFSGRA